jgi:ABC-type Zn uptake system ZnuABC Zn-binding protein ZnuA
MKKFFNNPVRRVGVLCVALFVSLVVGCGSAESSQESAVEVRAVTTISVLRDLVERVGGERVVVSTIVPVGGSPETFQPSPSDARGISESDVVFQNGLGLEDWLDDLLQSAGDGDARVVELAEGLETIEEKENEHEGASSGEAADADQDAHAEGNPHLWLDVSNTRIYVEKIRDALTEVDPEGAGEYEANAEEYLAELEELDGYIRERTAEIPEKNRKLVTFHDAFPYFAEAYGFERAGVILQNPDAEASGREVAEVVRTVREEGVPAIFTEPQFNAGLADTIAEETGVEVYELYSDTLAEESEAGSYEEMMRTNVDRIAGGLG